MKTIKKSGAGHVGVYQLSAGVNSPVSNDSNAKIAEFFLQETDRHSVLKTDLFGLRSGF